MDDAESYLKRVSKMERQHFSKGFASAKRIPEGVVQLPSADKEFSTLHLAYYRTTNILPMKRKRNCSIGNDTALGVKSANPSQVGPATSGSGGARRSCLMDAGVPSVDAKRASDSTPFLDAAGTPSSSAPASGVPQRRVSLIDKWFPGTTLKEATVEVSHTPSVEFVQETVGRVTGAREKMILLRSGVEDLEGLLRKWTTSRGTQPTGHRAGNRNENREGDVWTDSEMSILVKRVGLASISEALAQFALEPYQRSGTVKQQLRQLMHRKNIFATPHSFRIELLQEFLDLKGPETSNLPTLSHFIWLSSVGTTELFTTLTQRFLRRIRTHASSANDTLGEMVYQVSGTEGSPKTSGDNEEENNSPCCKRDDMTATANDFQNKPGDQSGALPPSVSLTQSQQLLLSFFRAFMPIWGVPHEVSTVGLADGATSGPRLMSSGYGVWLLACLVALDTPLDPDTDRLVHRLFRTSCEQIRVLGEWKGVHGEKRGALLEALEKCDSSSLLDAKYKTYIRIEDLGAEDLRALYTIVVILAKFFRQNQNRFIPL
ncbi:unnamed protein product [Phytomonas sp. EM1]|nr:unnamed protein product [Phytomonas sp. EM1]|eukprot:CCW60000.1 unnamed protein product [Phytomonas sp. isolate EM1]